MLHSHYLQYQPSRFRKALAEQNTNNTADYVCPPSSDRSSKDPNNTDQMTKRLTSFFLLVVILFQSCTAWHKTAVPIQDAVSTGKAKLIQNDHKFIFDQIIMRDGIFYGQTSDMDIRISDQNAMVYLKNKKKSGIRTLFLIITVGAIGFFIGAGIAFANTYG